MAERRGSPRIELSVACTLREQRYGVYALRFEGVPDAVAHSLASIA